jgi:hypothetical protein
VVALATTKGTVAAGAAGEAAQSTFCCSEGHNDPSTRTPGSLFLATHVSLYVLQTSRTLYATPL